jgi:hypothetical protein
MYLKSRDSISLLAKRLKHLNRLQEEVNWELSATASKDLDRCDLLKDSFQPLTI